MKRAVKTAASDEKPAEADVEGVPGDVEQMPADQPEDEFPEGTLLGIWDSRFQKWFTLTTGEIFHTDDPHLARAQLKNIEEPGRHSIVVMP